MKKILAITTTILALSNTAYADLDENPRFYLKGAVGANKMNKMTEKNSLFGVATPSNKSKSEISPSFIIGAGMYINDKIRTEINFDYSSIKFKNNSVDFNVYDTEEDIRYLGKTDLTRKSSVSSLMLDAYIDLPMLDNISMFFGAGLGLARINEKITQTWGMVAFDGNTVVDTRTDKSTEKSKTKNNFAYSLTVGSSIKVAQNIHLELSYKWKDYGKTSYSKASGATKNDYNGHMITTGIRFDL